MTKIPESLRYKINTFNIKYLKDLNIRYFSRKNNKTLVMYSLFSLNQIAFKEILKDVNIVI